MKRFICVLVSVLVSVSVFVLGLSAEDLVREDPLLSAEDHVVLRSASSPEYVLKPSGISVFGQWLSDAGYTSSSSLYFPSDVIYRYLPQNPSSSSPISGGFYYDSVSGYVRCYLYDGASSSSLQGYSLAFDSADLYDFFRFTVGVSYSDFDYGNSNSDVIAQSLELGHSVFSVGSSLFTFITSSWITVVALVSFVLVLGFGVIRRIVKGV